MPIDGALGQLQPIGDLLIGQFFFPAQPEDEFALWGHLLDTLLDDTLHLFHVIGKRQPVGMFHAVEQGVLLVSGSAAPAPEGVEGFVAGDGEQIIVQRIYPGKLRTVDPYLHKDILGDVADGVGVVENRFHEPAHLCIVTVEDIFIGRCVPVGKPFENIFIRCAGLDSVSMWLN